MHNTFINNIIFRSVVPLFFGIVVYIMVLLFFDDINRLTDNFFSLEVVLCIVLSYFVSEGMRLATVITNKFVAKRYSSVVLILVQILSTGIVSAGITYLIISLYMEYVVGLTSYGSELMIFIAIFLVSGICYSLVMISMHYLYKVSTEKYQTAHSHKEFIETELETYKSKINPDLLYKSLENIIVLAGHSAAEADEFIGILSDHYRYVLKGTGTEPSSLAEEMKLCVNYIDLINHFHGNNISISHEDALFSKEFNMVSGALFRICEYIINNSIINDRLALNIILQTEDEKLVIKCVRKQNISKQWLNEKQLEKTFEVYKNVYNKSIDLHEDTGSVLLKVPFIN